MHSKVDPGRKYKQRLSFLLISYIRRYYPSGTRLIPEDDDEAYGRFEQACSVEQSYFAAAAETIGFELIIKPYVGPNSCRSPTILSYLLTSRRGIEKRVLVPQTKQESNKLKPILTRCLLSTTIPWLNRSILPETN